MLYVLSWSGRTIVSTTGDSIPFHKAHIYLRLMFNMCVYEKFRWKSMRKCLAIFLVEVFLSLSLSKSLRSHCLVAHLIICNVYVHVQKAPSPKENALQQNYTHCNFENLRKSLIRFWFSRQCDFLHWPF